MDDYRSPWRENMPTLEQREWTERLQKHGAWPGMIVGFVLGFLVAGWLGY